VLKSAFNSSLLASLVYHHCMIDQIIVDFDSDVSNSCCATTDTATHENYANVCSTTFRPSASTRTSFSSSISRQSEVSKQSNFAINYVHAHVTSSPYYNINLGWWVVRRRAATFYFISSTKPQKTRLRSPITYKI
jgi:hypothetical protein